MHNNVLPRKQKQAKTATIERSPILDPVMLLGCVQIANWKMAVMRCSASTLVDIELCRLTGASFG